jgi:hypothetical protein
MASDKHGALIQLADHAAKSALIGSRLRTGPVAVILSYSAQT